MNDNFQDYSTEGTAPVVVPGSDSVPEPVVAPDNPILLPAPGPGPSKSPMSKQMKIMLGLFSAVILVSGLVTSLLLVKQKQDQRSKAFSPGNCRCSGTAWICENESGGHDYKGEEPSCQTGTPPSSVETKVTDPNTGITTTTSQVTTITNPDKTTTTKTYTNTDTSNPNTTGGTGINNTGGISVTSGSGSVVTNRNLDVPITSLCEIKTCTTRAQWEDGANAIKNRGSNCHSVIESELKAQNKLKDYVSGTNILDYVSSGKVTLNTIYTDAVIDLDGDSSNGNQVAELKRTCTGASNCTYTYGAVKTVTLNSDPKCQPGNNKCLTDNMSTRDEPNAVVTKDASGKIVINGLTSRSGTSATNKIVYDGGGKTQAQCRVTSQVNAAGALEYGDFSAWCGGVPEASADQPLLKNGFCGIDGIQKAGKTCNEQFKANFGFNYTGGCELKTSGTSSDSNTQLANCNYGGSDLSGFKWTWDMYKGFTIIDLGRGAQYARYVCKNQTSLSSQGCNCPETTADKSCIKYTGADALKFNWSQCGVQQIDIDVPINPDSSTSAVNHVSRNIYNENCGTTTTTTVTTPGGPTGGGDNPPTTTTFSGPTPTPTTTNPQLACYQLQIFRGGTQIQPWQINQGDALIFRGFASVSGGAVVSKMRFVVTVNGVAQAPVDVNATLVGGLYQADYNYTITQNTSYSVSTTPI